MSYYSNPTANAAIGAVDAEIKRLRKEAKRLKALQKQGRLTPEAEARARKQFVGIYRRFLEEALKPGEQEEDACPPEAQSNRKPKGHRRKR